MQTENVRTAVEPSDDVVLTLLGTDAGFRDRVEAALMRRKIPAVLMEDIQRGAFRPLLVRILGDDNGDPLRWATHAPGVHGLEPFEWTGLIAELSTELGSVVAAHTGIFGGAAGFPWDEDDDEQRDEQQADADLADEIAAFEAAFAVDSFTWYTRGDTDIVSVLARRAGEPLAVCPAGDGYVASPTRSPDSVFDGGIWASKGGLLLARSAGRRGVGFFSKRDPVVVHWWDESWVTVDPSRPWEADGEGRHVRDFLDLLLPEPEPELLVENFGLDDEHAEEIRILFRAPTSDESTFGRLVSAVGLPALLADVATGRVLMHDADGYRTIEPKSLWHAMTAMARDEFRRPVDYPRWASPVAKWEEHRRRRSRPYVAYMGVAIAVLLAATVADLMFREPGGPLWWKVVGLAFLVMDLCRPRRRGEEVLPAADGIRSPEKPPSPSE